MRVRKRLRLLMRCGVVFVGGAAVWKAQLKSLR